MFQSLHTLVIPICIIVTALLNFSEMCFYFRFSAILYFASLRTTPDLIEFCRPYIFPWKRMAELIEFFKKSASIQLFLQDWKK